MFQSVEINNSKYYDFKEYAINTNHFYNVQKKQETFSAHNMQSTYNQRL